MYVVSTTEEHHRQQEGLDPLAEGLIEERFAREDQGSKTIHSEEALGSFDTVALYVDRETLKDVDEALVVHTLKRNQLTQRNNTGPEVKRRDGEHVNTIVLGWTSV
jgi:hypothetical protein